MEYEMQWQVLGALRQSLSVNQGMAPVDELRTLTWHSMRIDLMKTAGKSEQTAHFSG